VRPPDDGGGVQPTCFVAPCLFTVTPTTQTVPAAGGTFTATVTRTQGGPDCTFGAEGVDPSFVSVTGGASGSGETSTVTYTVAANTGAARSSAVRIRWTNNSTLLTINQAGGAGAFTLTDSTNTPTPVTTCSIRTMTTQCILTATAPVSGTATYAWAVSYNYGPTTFNHSGAGQTFTFTQSCGLSGSSASGVEATLEVTLTVTDANGTTTYRAGVDQPGLIIKFFTC
jgi:hypothetical protein